MIANSTIISRDSGFGKKIIAQKVTIKIIFIIFSGCWTWFGSGFKIPAGQMMIFKVNYVANLFYPWTAPRGPVRSGENNMAHDDSHTCACGGNCACQSEQSQVYLTPAEYVARLEQYLADLKAEIVSVEAELASLRQTA
jgi:hypothetical protein